MNVPIYYTLQQCDEVTVENMTMPYMKSFYSCLNRMIGEGYTDTFERLNDYRFQSKKTGRSFQKSDWKVVDFFRFEGNADPLDNVTMYIIETSDGVKGTMIGSYDPLLLPEARQVNLFA